MPADLQLTTGGPSRPYVPAVRKDDGTRSTHTDESIIEVEGPALGLLTETAPASDTASSGINGRLQRIAQRTTSLIGLLPTSIGQKASSNSLSTDQASNGVVATAYGALSDAATPDITAGGASFTFHALFKGMVANLLAIKTSLGPDQDPVFDNANGARVSITASAALITPPAGCKYLRIHSSADIYVNTANAAAADAAASILILANSPEVIPVTAGTEVRAMSVSGSAAIVRAMPLKVRP